MVSIKIAAERLGCMEQTFYTPRFTPFLIKAKKGSCKAMFDIDGFIKYENTKTELIEKTRLLTEYLNKIEDVTYKQLEELTGVPLHSICQCTYGFDPAYQIAKAIRDKRPFHFKRFEEYYGW